MASPSSYLTRNSDLGHPGRAASGEISGGPEDAVPAYGMKKNTAGAIGPMKFSVPGSVNAPNQT